MDVPTKLVPVKELGLEFEVLAGDLVIGPSIEKGAWEAHETHLFKSHLEPGCRVIDLGANVGWFAVQAILAGAEVHAFEPVPFIADVCARNVERAMRIGPGRAVLHRVAAGSERGRARIAIGARNFGDNRVVEGERPRDMGEGHMVEIEIAPVDELVDGSARLFKIDTQGSEWHALQGMRKLLDRSRACAMLIEFWPYALRGCEPRQLLQFLVDQGFTIGKATEAPYPMSVDRLLKQALDPRRDPVKGGMDLYAVRGRPFHVTSLKNRVRALVRSWKED